MSELYQIEFFEVHVTPMNPLLITTAWSQTAGRGFSGEWFIVYPGEKAPLAGANDFGATSTLEAVLSDMRDQAVAKMNTVEHQRFQRQTWRHDDSPYQTPAVTPGEPTDLLPYWVHDIAADALNEVARETKGALLKEHLVLLRGLVKSQKLST